VRKSRRVTQWWSVPTSRRHFSGNHTEEVDDQKLRAYKGPCVHPRNNQMNLRKPLRFQRFNRNPQLSTNAPQRIQHKRDRNLEFQRVSTTEFNLPSKQGVARSSRAGCICTESLCRFMPTLSVVLLLTGMDNIDRLQSLHRSPNRRILVNNRYEAHAFRLDLSKSTQYERSSSEFFLFSAKTVKCSFENATFHLSWGPESSSVVLSPQKNF
jgi:hypothetical protein